MKKLASGNGITKARRPGFGIALRLAAACLLSELSTTPAALLSVRRASDAHKQGSLQPPAQLSWDAAIDATKPSQELLALLERAHSAADPLAPEVSPEEIKAAISSLNSMALKAQENLDAKTFDCKGFEEDNHRLFAQVDYDITRLNSEQSAGQARLASARESLAGLDTQRLGLKGRHAEEDKVLGRRKSSLQERLKRTNDDITTSEFMLDMTKCNAVLLSSVKSNANLRNTEASIKVCKRLGGAFEIEFDDHRLQNLTHSLTPEGQWMLQLALGRSRVASQGLLAELLAKEGSLDVMEDGDELMLSKVARPKEVDEQRANKCAMQAKPSCGEMHDIFVNLWGDMRDSADQLEDELQTMAQSQKASLANFQTQLVSLGNSQGTLEANVVDIQSLQAELAGEVAGKARELGRMRGFISKTKEECKTTLEVIVRGELCGISKLRSDLIAKLEENAPKDCRVSEWKLSSPCNKTCGGGVKTFKRKLIERGSPLGTACPALEMSTSCNDVGCPVDCKLGSWAPWANCTAACGGGLRYRTRARDVSPKNGGFACNVMQETQQCNTGACDRNCRLGEWSAFSACSQACDTGFSSRRKSVVRPVIGAGRCAAQDSSERLERKQCNTNKCAGDEMCTSKLDLVVAIDGSGSMTSAGFAIMQTFAAKLVQRMSTGADKVRAGVVQFGNGALDATNVVSDAKAVLKLSTDMELAESTIMGLTFQKGFTNLAQAIMKSRDLLRAAPPRQGAERVVILLTDGRPSFKHMAAEAVRQLKESARIMVVQVKTFPEKHNMELLRTYASEPVEVNYLHIAGKDALKKSYDAFVTKLLAQACQSVVSKGKNQ